MSTTKLIKPTKSIKPIKLDRRASFRPAAIKLLQTSVQGRFAAAGSLLSSSSIFSDAKDAKIEKVEPAEMKTKVKEPITTITSTATASSPNSGSWHNCRHFESWKVNFTKTMVSCSNHNGESCGLSFYLTKLKDEWAHDDYREEFEDYFCHQLMCESYKMKLESQSQLETAQTSALPLSQLYENFSTVGETGRGKVVARCWSRQVSLAMPHLIKFRSRVCKKNFSHPKLFPATSNFFFKLFETFFVSKIKKKRCR